MLECDICEVLALFKIDKMMVDAYFLYSRFIKKITYLLCLLKIGDLQFSNVHGNAIQCYLNYTLLS